MRFLIAGFGSIGRRHFRNLLTLGYDDIILCRSQKSTLDTDELRGFIVETSLEKALNHQPDAVIISNPTSLHLDVAIPAAARGMHLFFEKPISHNLDRVSDLYSALKAGGGKAVTGFQYRFHPGLEKVKEWANSGMIGNVITARAHWGEYLPSWHPWEDHRKSYSGRVDLGGGVVLTLCHPIDYLRWMFGEVNAIWGSTSQIPSLEIEAEAIADIGLQFDQMAAQIHLNYIQRPGKHTLEVIGDQGTIHWNNQDGSAACYSAPTDQWSHFKPADDFERNTLFIDEMKNFIDFVANRAEPRCTLDDGIRVQEIIEAFSLSQTEKRQIKLT